MKYQTPLTLLLLALLLTSTLVGCDALVDGYDKDPNLATEAPNSLILTGAQAGGILLQEGNLARTAGIWVGHFTGSDRQYLSYEVYGVNAGDFNSMWNLAYANLVSQTRDIRLKASEEDNRLYRGIASIVEAQTYGTMTALFGDIPYSEASQPFDFPEPMFDPQEQIYAGVQQMLSDAIADLESGVGSSPGNADIYFSGSTSKWIGAANTLKARYYMHTGNYAQAVTYAQDGISSPANDMISPHGSTTGKDINPYYAFVVEDRAGYMTADGARAALMMTPGHALYRGNDKTDESARRAFYYGGSSPEYVLATSSDRAFAADADFPQITYLENQLILAEALLLANNDVAGALEALNTARAALSSQYGADTYQAYEEADFEAGGIANTENESKAKALLREILEEKYLSLIGQLEAFSDARRTDNFLGLPIKNGTRYPQRFLIAQDEIGANENAPNPPPGIFEETTVNQKVNYEGANL